MTERKSNDRRDADRRDSERRAQRPWVIDLADRRSGYDRRSQDRRVGHDRRATDA